MVVMPFGEVVYWMASGEVSEEVKVIVMGRFVLLALRVIVTWKWGLDIVSRKRGRKPRYLVSRIFSCYVSYIIAVIVSSGLHKWLFAYSWWIDFIGEETLNLTFGASLACKYLLFLINMQDTNAS